MLHIVTLLALAKGAPSELRDIKQTLATLQTEPEPPRSGFARTAFVHWIDDDGDGCDARQNVLLRDSQSRIDRAAAAIRRHCGKQATFSPEGPWKCAYSSAIITASLQVDVDHLIPLAEAWDSGANKWTPRNVGLLRMTSRIQKRCKWHLGP